MKEVLFCLKSDFGSPNEPLNDWKKRESSAVPFGGPIDSGLERLNHGGIEAGETIFEAGETFAGFPKPWHQLLIQKHRDKRP